MVLKERVANLHRKSTAPSDKGAPDPDRQPRNDRRSWFSRVPWGFLTFLIAIGFGGWKFVPPGYLPPSMTYANVMGRLEGSTQSAATEASMNSMAAAEGLKAGAAANAAMPAAIDQAVSIANQTAPITVHISAEQAKIEQVKSCRMTMMQGAGQAYASCVAGNYEAGAECDARRELVLQRYADCGVLPGEDAAPSAPGGQEEKKP